MRMIATIAPVLFLFSGMSLASDLDGTWKTKCLDSGRSGGIEQLTFSEDTAVFTGFSMDKTCKQKYLTSEMTSTYLTKGASPQNPDATMTDLVVQSMVMTPTHPQVVAYFNSAKFCGFSDWVINEPKDVAGLVCDDSIQMPNVGDKSYQIYKIDGDALYFGKTEGELNGDTEETRPTEIDADLQYLKQ